MKRFLAHLSFDGSKFAGFNKQLNTANTVQAKIESNLYQIFKRKINVTAAGRTDKGVHAFNLPIHFDVNGIQSIEKFQKILNQKNKNQFLFWKNIQLVEPSFHARFACKMKEYHYLIKTSNINPWDQDYYCCLPALKIISLAKINDYLTNFHGIYDFINFCKQPEQYKTCIKQIIQFQCFFLKEGVYLFKILSPSFLQQMVRRLIAAVLAKLVFDFPNKIAPAGGLYFYHAYYF